MAQLADGDMTPDTNDMAPCARSYWMALAGSAFGGWGGLAAAIWLWPSPWGLLALVIGAWFLYRGMLLVHEISHRRQGELPGFRMAWELTFGAPLLLPSAAYVGVHRHHHHAARYGTGQDPEWAPFAGRPLLMAATLAHAPFIPVVLAVRWSISPVGWVVPSLRRWLHTHVSALVLNPSYRSTLNEAEQRWLTMGEILTCVVLASFVVLPMVCLWVWLAAMVLISTINVVRVLTAHAYVDHDGPRSYEAQLFDSIDLPDSIWARILAPLALHRHGSHHAYPGVPFHALARLSPQPAVASRPGLLAALRALAASSSG